MINRIAEYDLLRIASERSLELMTAGDCSAAVELWNTYLRDDPGCAQAYFERGRAKAVEGVDAVGMLSDYHKAVEIEPTNRGFRFVFHLTLGGAIQAEANGSDQGQILAAIRHYDIAIETAPEYADAYTNRGTAYLQNDNVDQALCDFTKAIQLDSANALALLMRGTVALHSGQLADAKLDLESAKVHRGRLAPEYANLLDERYAELVTQLVGK